MNFQLNTKHKFVIFYIFHFIPMSFFVNITMFSCVDMLFCSKTIYRLAKDMMKECVFQHSRPF